MSAVKYILKVLGTHIVAVIVMALMMMTLLLIFRENRWYQIVISFALAAFYWAFMCFALEKDAVYDAKKDKFDVKKILVAAAVLNIPNIAFIALDLFETGGVQLGDIFKLLFRYWNAGYLNFLIITKDSIWMRVAVVVLYFPGLAFAYYRGMLIKKKTDRTIESMKQEASLHGTKSK